MDDSKRYKEIAYLVKKAKRILFITGAGLSADSGLPTYRGIGGLYNGKLTADDMPIEVALSGSVMQQSPEITWKYLLQIEESCRDAGFNTGHEYIARLEELKPDSWVLTQNIDGFHLDAGSRHVIEIHGNFSELYCTRCDYRSMVENYEGLSVPPSCPTCGSLVRPNVVLFGEMLPTKACDILQKQLSFGFDLIFSIGTTSVFPYIAQPVIEARRWGVPTVEINPGTTEVSDYVDYKITAGGAEALKNIWRYSYGEARAELSEP